MPLDYRDIASSMSRDFASPDFLIDTARILRSGNVRQPGGGNKREYVPIDTDIPCRVGKGQTQEVALGGVQSTTLIADIFLPPGTDEIKQDDRIEVTNSSTGEIRVFEVRGIHMPTFEVVRKIDAIQVV
jgi:hypothetical protein